MELEGHGRDAVEDEIDVSRTFGWFTTMYPVNVHVSETLPITYELSKKRYVKCRIKVQTMAVVTH
ncbi:hypothetical protein ACEQPO_04695 [Bacillus sp. SL00103]